MIVEPLTIVHDASENGKIGFRKPKQKYYAGQSRQSLPADMDGGGQEVPIRIKAYAH